MSNLEISKDEIKDFKKLSIIEKLTPLKEYVKLLEKKYQCNFEELEDKVNNDPENFELWDSYIEWKAYQEKTNELTKKYEEIEHADSIRFVE
ncbi:hypothetical protein [Natranaerofaba carboxydovora]|uniref:hypothetical protein n=1 Tax=Natranaerofaba carboxydovora TaxID=2742683 RepID=UPI001F12AE3C|nr:hypothetical protein [Natranaerofaba carboxydovora]UMZ74984.1 hypothetical protein ACONDI_02590 [Natranaerofaba carboxydovora]